MTDSHLSPQRERFTTASQARIIVHGSADDLFALWQERIGEKAPEDLSNNLPVQLGKLCEPFILNWVERADQHEITERQRFIEHPTLPFACTLDGYRAFDDAVVEAKHCNPFSDRRDIITEYTPQVLIQQRCRNAARGILAVLRGFTLEQFEINTDAAYEREVFDRLTAFQRCCDTMTPPVHRPVLVPPELWRTVDLAKAVPLPNWGAPMIETMRQWSQTREAARQHEASKKTVKEMLPDDVGAVLYGDMSVRRAKNGAVTIREREVL
jgi:YqaJ-like recombinase protein